MRDHDLLHGLLFGLRQTCLISRNCRRRSLLNNRSGHSRLLLLSCLNGAHLLGHLLLPKRRRSGLECRGLLLRCSWLWYLLSLSRLGLRSFRLACHARLQGTQSVCTGSRERRLNGNSRLTLRPLLDLLALLTLLCLLRLLDSRLVH